MTKINKTFKDFLDLSKGEHSLEEILERANRNMEEYDGWTRYNKAEDGLPKDKYFDEEDYDSHKPQEAGSSAEDFIK